MRRFYHLLLLLPLLCCGGAAAQSPARVELFLDKDAGYGLALAFTDVHVGGNALTFDLVETPSGAHILYVRAQDSEGRWSATMSRPLFIDRYQDIVYVEYYFDTDPGVGKADAVQLPDQAYKGHLTLDLDFDVSGLSLGEHELFVRALDRYDQWTDVESRRFTIVKQDVVVPDPPQPEGDFSLLEYFFDADPGYGQGRRLETPRLGANSYLMDFADIPDGAHVLYLRVQDTNGIWSATISRPLYIYRTTGSVAAMEYFFDGDDPGEGNAESVAVPQDTREPFAFEVPLGSLLPGEHQFSVRARDDGGRWSVVRSEPFLVEDTRTGLKSVERLMPIGISATRQTCTLTADRDMAYGSRVEVLTVDGIRVASAEWPQGRSQLTLPLNVPGGTVLIVSVEDATNHRRVVQRIVVR